ncbi:tetratricopeptide repeat protein, partial [bacterium]|nr:tetratricopeptide repeat protein [bacterium]
MLVTGFGKNNGKKRINHLFSIEKTGEALHRKGIDHHKKGELEYAEKAYREAINLGFLHHDLDTNLGRICAKTGRSEEAISFFLKALEFNPNDLNICDALCRLYKITNNLKPALALNLKLVDLKPEDAYTHFSLGGIYLDIGNLDQALSSTLKSIELQPNNHTAYINLGTIYRMKGRFDEAISSTLRSIDLKPDNYSAYISAGWTYFLMGDIGNAIQFTLRSLDFSETSKAYANLGLIYNQMGKPEQAIISTLKSIEINPDNVFALMTLSSIYYERGEQDHAQKLVAKALAIEPNNPNTLYGLARIQNSNGDTENAKITIQKALDIDPHLPEVLLEASLSAENVKTAKALLAKIEEALCKSPLAHKVFLLKFAESNCFHKLKDFERASNSLIEANKLRRSRATRHPIDLNRLILRMKGMEKTTSLNLDTKKKPDKEINHIFVVGMPRSGSTLISSILSTNSLIRDLGESKAMGQSLAIYLNEKHNNEKEDLTSIYKRLTKVLLKPGEITIDKQLHNALNCSYIIDHINNSRIIHATRNPLDNILSMLRVNFKPQSSISLYASSVEDSARVLIEQKKLMTSFIKKYPQSIYSYCYDDLVNNPKDELKKLLVWLGWEWNDEYLDF